MGLGCRSAHYDEAQRLDMCGGAPQGEGSTPVALGGWGGEGSNMLDNYTDYTF